MLQSTFHYLSFIALFHDKILLLINMPDSVSVYRQFILTSRVLIFLETGLQKFWTNWDLTSVWYGINVCCFILGPLVGCPVVRFQFWVDAQILCTDSDFIMLDWPDGGWETWGMGWGKRRLGCTTCTNTHMYHSRIVQD